MADIIKHVVKEDGTEDYTSCVAWEADQQRTLTTPDEIQHLEVVGSWTAAEASFLISGWVTNVDNYIKMWTSGDARHEGVWSNTAHRFYREANADVVSIVEFYCYMEGFQGWLKHSSGTDHATFLLGGAGDNGWFQECIGVLESSASISDGRAFEKQTNASQTVVPWALNCLAIEVGTTDGESYGFFEENSRTARLVACTAVGFKTSGFRPTNSDQGRHINCLEYDNVLGWSDSLHADSSNCACEDTSLDGGSSHNEETTFTFVNAGAGNYQLAIGDTGAVGLGADISAYTLIDIAGNTRITNDIGCFAVATAGGGEEEGAAATVLTDILSITDLINTH